MLKVVRSMKELPFGQLMQVCGETYDVVAEQDFYEYLRQCFFHTPSAVYCLWMEQEQCVSALRLEPWRNGWLLTGLETAPDRRGWGHASALIRAVQAFLGEQGPVRLYSHIDKRNAASIRTHEKCGFCKISNHAVYIDGSVDTRGATYLYEA